MKNKTKTMGYLVLIVSFLVVLSLAPEIHFDFWNYIGKVWDGTTQ